MRIAAFISHPIQYFTPLWQELSARPGVELRVFYFSRQGLLHSADAGFGLSFAWDIDLLAGHDHRFLPRRWPTRDPLDPTPCALNSGLLAALRQGWDVVFLNGYAHVNNHLLLAACRALAIPVLCFADSNLQAKRAQVPAKRISKSLVLRLLLPQVSAFLAAGGATRRYLEHYGVERDSIFICPYAVDIERFRRTVASADSARIDELRARWGIPSGPRVIMFCGKLVPRKRPLDVLHAVRAINRPDVLAVFVGDGEIREQIARTGGGQAVTVGFVNQSEIPLVLSFADVLVLSSDYEPYGMVVAEAQCLGVPAVVSDACGCHGPDSVVRDGVSGFVYPTGDVDALRDRLQKLLDDDPLLQRMRAAASSQGETQSQIAAADGLLNAATYARTRVARRG